MRGLRYVVFFLLLIGVGCTTPSATIALIEQSERVAIDYPDSALMLISHVDPDCVYGKHDKAHYRLAYSEALYYNQENMDCDSLTHPLFDYYYDSDNHAERARAMYQHGLVMMNAKKNAEAMYALMEAEKSLQHCDNPRLLGLVHRTMGDIYGSECLFKDGLHSVLKAKECFDKVGLKLHSAYCIFDIAQFYSKLRVYDKAIECYNLAEQSAIDIGDLELITRSQSELCMTYIYNNDITNSLLTIERIDYHTAEEWCKCNYFCAKAICESEVGNNEYAAELLELAARYADAYSQVYLNYAKYLVATNIGDYLTALNNYIVMVQTQDKHILNLINDSVLHYEIKLLKEDFVYTKELNRKIKQITYLVMLIVVLLASFLLFVLYNSNKRKLFQIATLKEQVDSAKQDLANLNNRVKHLSQLATEREQVEMSMRRQLLENIGISLQNIDSLLSSYYTDSTRQVKQNQIIDAIDSYVSEFASNENGYFAVERYVNQSRNNIMQTLRSEMPALNERDYMLLCLIYADFSTNAICMFMGYDKNKLYKHKCRLKAKIAESGCKSMSILLKYL